MENMKISVLAKNSEDLLIRITSVFHKRGFKINALVFSEDGNFAKAIITASGEPEKQEQMLKHLCKLHDIKEAQMAC